MNYLIARVSDPKQLDALPAQKQKLFDYAEKRNWTIKKTSSTQSLMKRLLKILGKSLMKM